MSGFFGSRVTQPIEYDPPSSKIGLQVVPRLVVFHSPPEAMATYQTLRLRGSMAMSPTRPGVMHGPIARSGSRLMVSVVRGSSAAAAERPSRHAASASPGATRQTVDDMAWLAFVMGVTE